MKFGSAYFTVEAALVFPFAMGTLLFVVYMLLFQYDRCLMEQDVGVMALRGSGTGEEGMEELREMLEKSAKELYLDKYAVWKMTAFEMRLERNRFSVTGKGELAFPAPGWNFWSGQNVWAAERTFSFGRISSTDFVRLCRRVGTQQKTEDNKKEIAER